MLSSFLSFSLPEVVFPRVSLHFFPFSMLPVWLSFSLFLSPAYPPSLPHCPFIYLSLLPSSLSLPPSQRHSAAGSSSNSIPTLIFFVWRWKFPLAAQRGGGSLNFWGRKEGQGWGSVEGLAFFLNPAAYGGKKNVKMWNTCFFFFFCFV